MPPTDRHFVLGYDSGGNGRHGLAVLQVQQQQGLWVASHIVALALRQKLHPWAKQAEPGQRIEG